MKIQAVLVVFLLFATLVAESDCWNHLPGRKRELEGKVRKALIFIRMTVYPAGTLIWQLAYN